MANIGDNRFIIIGRSDCRFCTYAVDFCLASGLENIFLDYEANSLILEEYKEYHSHDTVPIILANNLESGHTVKIGGYSDLLDWASQEDS